MKYLIKNILAICSVFAITSSPLTVFCQKCELCGTETSNPKYCDQCLYPPFRCGFAGCPNMVSQAQVQNNHRADKRICSILCPYHWQQRLTICRRCHINPIQTQNPQSLVCEACAAICMQCMGRNTSYINNLFCEECLDYHSTQPPITQLYQFVGVPFNFPPEAHP